MKKHLGMLAGTILLMGGGLAQAASFTYGSVTQNIGVATPSSVGITSPIIGTVGAGEIELIGSGPNVGQHLDVWCIDLLDTLQGADDSDLLRLLWRERAMETRP